MATNEVTIKTMVMPLKEFLDEDTWKANPIQRDTVRRGLIHSQPGHHLETYSPVHQRVSVCQTSTGKLKYVLDGHTRRFLWQSERLDPPPSGKLLVDCFIINDKQDALDLWLKFDAPSSVAGKMDELFGALRYHGLNAQHKPVLENFGVHTALQYLAFPNRRTDMKGMTTVALTKPWVAALRTMDTMDPLYQTPVFPAPVTASMLCTIRRDGNEALSFWQNYHNDIGSRTGKSMCGILKAKELLWEMKHPRTIDELRQTRVGRIAQLAPKFIYCYEQWMDGKRFTLAPGTGKRTWPRTMPTVTEWWRDNIGEPDHPHLRQQQLDLADD